MKKVKKIIYVFLMFLGIISSFSFLNVEAKSAPSTVTMKEKSKLYYFDGDTDYIHGYNFYRKELTDGTYAYCIGTTKTKVPAGMTLKLKGENKDKGLDYIIRNGYPHKSFTGDSKKDYYITQAAVWKYLDETTGTKNWNNFVFDANSTGMKLHVYNLVQAAKVANSSKDEEKKVSITPVYLNNKMSLTSDGNYYVSDTIKVLAVNTSGKYTVNLTSAPSGTIVKNENGKEQKEFEPTEGFKVYVPVKSVNEGKGVVKVKLTAVGVSSKTYIYTPDKTNYQDIIPVEIYDTVSDLVSSELELTYEKIITKVKISKQDITTKKELAGATLTVKDKNGKVVDEWVSTTTPHYIENLAAGEYTLTEKIAPNGYVLSTETVKFTVKADGTTTNVIMYNTKEVKTTKVKISKQDITTKKELAGATLTVKDKNGKVVDEWVSTTTPHYIENLAAGEYTLTEKIAPNRYVLSTETVKFTVKADGTTTNVVMYNKMKLTEIKISKQDITTKEELAGATLTVKDSKGKVVDEWVSTKTPHYIKNLNEGEYTLTEKIAPNGYILSSETIKFTVKADGKVETVIMYNVKDDPKVTKVKISKQDITTKEEIAGATLIIKDKDGKVVDEWVSTTTPHYIEGLKEGEYTLTETIAPDGYVLSSEAVKFTVKADNNITSVVMYNTPYTEVPITDLNINTTVIVVASILMLLGTGLVIYYAKFSK